MNIIDVAHYVKKHRYPFRPDILLLLHAYKNNIQSFMVHSKPQEYIPTPEKCYFCKQRFKMLNQKMQIYIHKKDWLCKKHLGLHLWNTAEVMNTITIDGVYYYLFGEYAMTPMNTDDHGMYLIWFDKIYKTFKTKNNVFTLFAINDQYLTNTPTIIEDITQELNAWDILVLNNMYMLVKDDDHYKLDRIKKSSV